MISFDLHLYIIYKCIFCILIHYHLLLPINQLHVVSRTQQVRQKEPSVKTLHSPLSAKIWRHYVVSGGTLRRALPSTPEQRNGNINLNEYFISSNPQPVDFTVTLCASAPRLASPRIISFIIVHLCRYTTMN